MTAERRSFSEADFDREQWRRSFRRKYWIGVSVVASSIIFGVAFTTPFQRDELLLQKPAPPVVSSRPAATPVNRSIEPAVVQPAPKPSNDRFLQEIHQLDAQFMQQVRAKRAAADAIPTPEQVRARWQHIKSRRSERIESLKDTKPGSLEARYRQELIDAAADGPL